MLKELESELFEARGAWWWVDGRIACTYEQGAETPEGRRYLGLYLLKQHLENNARDWKIFRIKREAIAGLPKAMQEHANNGGLFRYHRGEGDWGWLEEYEKDIMMQPTATRVSGEIMALYTEEVKEDASL